MPLPRLLAPWLALAIAAAAPVAAQPAATPPAMSGAPSFGNPLPAVRSDNWPAAAAAVAGYADPVAGLLVTYLRLVAPNAARADEIAHFMADHPDWPNQDLLERRREEALAVAPAGAGLLAQCTLAPLSLAAAQLRCAEAWEQAGDPQAATAAARRAWVGTEITDPAHEAAVLQRWGAVLTEADQWTRFQALAWAASPAAPRQAERLSAARRPQAEARLALQRSAAAPALLAAVAAAAAWGADDPGTLLDRARALRRAGRLTEALALWTQAGAAAEDAAPVHAEAFWTERALLARALLRPHDGGAGDPDGAFAVVAGRGPVAGGAAADADFLCGWIALRRLDAPGLAAGYFTRLAATGGAAITQGRAWYWLGRAVAAGGGDPRPAWRAAAAWPVTFYGQLAAQALGEDPGGRLRAARDPAWTQDQAVALATAPLARAAGLLIAWGEPRRARAFLLRLAETATQPALQAAVAHLALATDDAPVAVGIARRMGRDGAMLPLAGWPAPYAPPPAPLEPAVALGVMRQESSFDTGAVSPAGARGLMQLMPATAIATARTLGQTVAVAALTSDPPLNMRLGGTYLQGLIGHFGGVLPLAVAAYNAGPNRVQDWLAANGDPRGHAPDAPHDDELAPGAGGIDMIDWIELIPFAETRNYVQRVLENVTIYRARLAAGPTPAPVPPAAPLPVAARSP